MRNIPCCFLVLIVLSLFSCGKENKSNTYRYAHFAHTRIHDTIHQKLDPRVEKIDFKKFDMLLLGGDLTEDTSEDFETLEYLDGLLDLTSPDVLWAMGNHDNTNLENVERITNKPIYYAYHKNGITFVVLNTHYKTDWRNSLSEPQLELIRNVTDTIKESSHLVVMTHELVWILWHPEMSEHIGKNGYYSWSCNYGMVKNNWHAEVRPLLRQTQQKGVQVVCLAGDIGNNKKEFEEFASDGIVYLASGINPVDKDVKFLLFNHEPPELHWEYVELEKYLAAGQDWELTRRIDLSPWKERGNKNEN